MVEQIGGNNEAHWVVKFAEHLKCLWNENKVASRHLYFFLKTTMQDNYYNQSCQETKTLALLIFLEIN